MKLIIKDLPPKDKTPAQQGAVVLAYDEGIRPCTGCFGCWVQTPGQCVIRDRFGEMGAMIARAEEVVLISRLCYGGFSPFVKNVLDRSISYIHPNFILKNGEMHHKRRYRHSFRLCVCFYGRDVSQKEKEAARQLVAANALNLHCEVSQILFSENPDAFEEMF